MSETTDDVDGDGQEDQEQEEEEQAKAELGPDKILVGFQISIPGSWFDSPELRTLAPLPHLLGAQETSSCR